MNHCRADGSRAAENAAIHDVERAAEGVIHPQRPARNGRRAGKAARVPGEVRIPRQNRDRAMSRNVRRKHVARAGMIEHQRAVAIAKCDPIGFNGSGRRRCLAVFIANDECSTTVGISGNIDAPRAITDVQTSIIHQDQCAGTGFSDKSLILNEPYRTITRNNCLSVATPGHTK